MKKQFYVLKELRQTLKENFNDPKYHQLKVNIWLDIIVMLIFRIKKSYGIFVKDVQGMEIYVDLIGKTDLGKEYTEPRNLRKNFTVVPIGAQLWYTPNFKAWCFKTFAIDGSWYYEIGFLGLGDENSKNAKVKMGFQKIKSNLPKIIDNRFVKEGFLKVSDYNNYKVKKLKHIIHDHPETQRLFNISGDSVIVDEQFKHYFQTSAELGNEKEGENHYHIIVDRKEFFKIRETF